MVHIENLLLIVALLCLHQPVDALTIPGDPNDSIALSVSYVGMVAAFLMFISPLPTIHRIIKERDITFFSENACLVTACGCMLWMAYAIATPDRMTPLITNIIGFIIQGSYCVIFVIYSSNGPSRSRVRSKMFGSYLIVILIVSFAFGALHKHAATTLIPDFTESGDSQQTIFLGLIASAFNIGVYAAPLSVMRLVIETKNAESMPLPLTTMGLFGSCIWFFYGLYVDDIFILVPNCVGMVLSTMQLLLIVKYRNPVKVKCDVVGSTTIPPVALDEIPLTQGGILPMIPETVQEHDIPTDTITLAVEMIMENLPSIDIPPSPLVMARAASETIMNTLREFELPSQHPNMAETTDMINMPSPLHMPAPPLTAPPLYEQL